MTPISPQPRQPAATVLAATAPGRAAYKVIHKVKQALKQSLLPCSAVILEANYDRDMLFSGSYPHFLKLRIASDTGHLDNDRSAELCAFLASHNTKRVLLSHLSAENNTPEAALRAVQRSLADCSCQLSVDTAQRFMPTELVDLYV